ncbi:MAG: dihydrofolate reductase family protein [Acidimicrobiales bacterium]
MEPSEDSDGKVVWNVRMSLDGFIAGPKDSMDWIFRFGRPDTFAETIRRTGALLVGRNSYDVGTRENAIPETEEPFGGAWSGPQFVLTHQAPAPQEGSPVTFLSGDIRKAVATALGAAGGKDVQIIGADIARQCIEAGTLDEINVEVAPILLGDGVRFFGRPGVASVDLEPTAVAQVGALTSLSFHVVRRQR